MPAEQVAEDHLPAEVASPPAPRPPPQSASIIRPSDSNESTRTRLNAPIAHVSSRSAMNVACFGSSQRIGGPSGSAHGVGDPPENAGGLPAAGPADDERDGHTDA